MSMRRMIAQFLVAATDDQPGPTGTPLPPTNAEILTAVGEMLRILSRSDPRDSHRQALDHVASIAIDMANHL